MSDPKPTVSTVSPIGWEPKAGDKVERLNAPLPRLIGTVSAVRYSLITGNEASVYWEWEDNAQWVSFSKLTWHNPEAT